MINVFLFDWGDTLMRVFPEYSGPMAHWPQVEAIPGAMEALSALKGNFQLVVATNAAESGQALVRQALAMVDEDRYIDRIFTTQETGSRKPEPAFFARILSDLGISPPQAAMVGDSYEVDMCGATRAGLRAVWFNPAGEECPDGHPPHDVELLSMADLPLILDRFSLPTIPECLDWLEEQGLPDNIVAHSRMVARLAYRLAVWLRQAGESVDPVITHRGGLLHDLDKISSRQQGIDHARLSARLLAERGQPVLAEIARRHLVDSYGDPERAPRTWEEKLVFYADKLVEGDKVVRFPERMAALLERYPDYAEKIRQHAPDVVAVESEICSVLGLSPDPFFERLTG